MTIYIAGQIEGCPDYKEKFKKAKQELTGAGYTVLNPAELPEKMEKSKYMPICIAMIDQADGVYLLRNWINSKGAQIEKLYASYQGKRIFRSIEDIKKGGESE